MQQLIKRIAALFCVKSIVTIILTIVFACLSLNGKISTHDFLTVFSVVIAFYFGTQTQRSTAVITDKDTKENTAA